MNILGFDTSLDKMYLGLMTDKNNVITREVSSDKDKYHSAYLIPVIKELLNLNNLKMQDINGLVVGVGPGSFTGIRASVTIGRIMGQMLDLPVVSVSSLEILSGINSTEKPVICMLDARKEMVYFALFDKNNELKEPITAILFEDALKKIKDEDCFIVTDKNIQKKLEEQGINSVNYLDSNYNFGERLLKLGERALSKDKNHPWYELKPLYIQPPPIHQGCKATKKA